MSTDASKDSRGYFRDTIAPDLKTRMTREFFEPGGVTIDWRLQSQRTAEEEGRLTQVAIGPWAGPEANISNLVHEMSHFVEIDEPRMACFGWGLRLPEIWVYNRMCVEPTTMQATARELRVFAYQVNVLDYLGEPSSIEDLVGSMVHMPDLVHVPIEDGTQAWSEDRRAKDWDYREIEASQLRWCARQVEEHRKEFTLERFLSEWKRRNETLKALLTCSVS